MTRHETTAGAGRFGPESPIYQPDSILDDLRDAPRLPGWPAKLVPFLTMVFLLVRLAAPHHAFEGIANYAWLHLSLETLSVVVAGMTFSIAWHAYSAERPGNIMLLAIGLLATGIIDFMHALSFKGMPDFVTASDPEKAINFWLAARLIFALTLAMAALRSWVPLRRPWSRHAWLAAAMGLTGAVIWIGLYHQAWLPRTFVPGKGLTPFKLAVEYLIIAILTMPALALLWQDHERRILGTSNLFAAAAISILSELCFTLYADVTDIFNLLGHIYKVIAFGLIYRAVFISSAREPFERAVAAEAKMRYASFYVRSLIEASLDPLVMISPEGKITDVNKAAEDATGLHRASLVGTRFSDYFTEPQHAAMVHRNALADGEVRDFPLAIRHVSGHFTDVLCNATTYADEHGQVQGIVAAARDITQRKASEEMLRASEERLKIAMDAAHMGTWSWDVVHDVVSYSEEYSVLMGLPRGVSHPNREAVLAAIDSEDRERMAGVLQQAIQREKGYWVDFRISWPDGSIHWLTVRGIVTRDADGKPLKVSGIGMDITARKQNELALNRANRALRSLSAANERLIHAKDEQELLDSVCRVIVEVGGYRLAWVGAALHDEGKTVHPLAQWGDSDGFLQRTGIVWSDTPRGHGPTGSAIRDGITQVNQDFRTNSRMVPWRDEALKRGFQSSIAFPLRDDSGVHGALTIYSSEPDAFDADEMKLLQQLADDLAFGIVALRNGVEREHMQQEQQHYEIRLRESLVESVQAVAATLEMRDPYTAGHQKRVAALAVAIARKIGLPDMQVEGLRLAASVHDVGKICVPAEILNKPGRLNAIELDLIRLHAQAGHDILKDVRFPWPIARIVCEHHERLDGSGYPAGLRDEQILLESKILTVADVVEAMTSHRPYRPGLGIDAALEHVQASRGSWYAPEAVDACIALIRNEGYRLDAAPQVVFTSHDSH